MKLLGAVALALLLVVLPGSAAAGSQPAVYYLRDGEMGPAADGELNATVPNSTQPSARAVPVGATMVLPVRFAASDAEHPPRLLGPVYVALWLGPSPIVHGNMTVSLVAINGSEARSIANVSIPLDANASNLPQPTAVVPPPPSAPPSDPQAYAMYLAYFVMGQVLPAVQPPPRMMLLGVLDEEIGVGETLALDFSITQGSSPAPVPAGGFGSILYDGATSPSLVYVPWYSPDPKVVSTWSPPPPTRSVAPSSSAPPSSSEGIEPDEGGKGVPGPEFIVLALTLGAVVLAWRRR